MVEGMKQLKYRVRFVTPAFLGNAFQQGQWRTPPFKALLRQWWRVVKAPEVGYDVGKLRKKEALLFGSASDERGAVSRRSMVRLRLGEWKDGKIGNNDWQKIKFQRVTTTRDGKGSVPSDVYLGFGPVQKKYRSSTKLKAPPAVSAEMEGTLEVIIDSDQDNVIRQINTTLMLIHWFGTLGSRSRNGWGSITLMQNGQAPRLGTKELKRVSRPLRECLKDEWASAIGEDDKGPLVWITKNFENWPKAIDYLAKLKVEVRRVAKEHKGNGIGGIHLLGYPAGRKWEVSKWKKMRFASQLRFKVFEDRNGFRALIFHMPCTIPASLTGELEDVQRDWISNNQLKVWQEIQSTIDSDKDISRLAEVN